MYRLRSPGQEASNTEENHDTSLGIVASQESRFRRALYRLFFEFARDLDLWSRFRSCNLGISGERLGSPCEAAGCETVAFQQSRLAILMAFPYQSISGYLNATRP